MYGFQFNKNNIDILSINSSDHYESMCWSKEYKNGNKKLISTRNGKVKHIRFVKLVSNSIVLLFLFNCCI